MGLTACSGSATAAASPVGVSLAGQLAQISGSSLIVTDNQSRDTNLVYDSSTVIETSTSASLADVVPGRCVSGSGATDSSGRVAVRAVQVSSPVGGKCETATAAGPGRGVGPSPGAGASPNPARSPGRQQNFTPVSGLVTANDGTTVTVKSDSGTVTSVTLAPTARVTQLVALPSADLKVGDCLLARGSKAAAGAVKAALISVSQPGAAGCFAGGRGGFGPRGGAAPTPTPPS